LNEGGLGPIKIGRMTSVVAAMIMVMMMLGRMGTRREIPLKVGRDLIEHKDYTYLEHFNNYFDDECTKYKKFNVIIISESE
jgi:hypothetical protein